MIAELATCAFEFAGHAVAYLRFFFRLPCLDGASFLPVTLLLPCSQAWAMSGWAICMKRRWASLWNGIHLPPPVPVDHHREDDQYASGRQAHSESAEDDC